MLVMYWMSRPVISIDKKDTMQRAIALINENKIRLLPVTDKGALCGILSDRDLKRASASDATSLDVHELLYLISKIKVGDIMTHDVITVNPDFTLEEAADVMLSHKLSGVPVVDDKDQLCGVITQTDLFKATLYITGLKKRGIHLAFVLEDKPGSIKALVDVVRLFGGRMASILSTYERAPLGYRNVYLRCYGVLRERLDDMLEILKGKAELRYVVDHRKNQRIVFEGRQTN
jgi:acetoin utilization protein AcuB